jgi:tetrahydromethanopterin S-methyltransferase subunit G
MEDISIDKLIEETSSAGGPHLRSLMQSLKELEARMDNAEANSLGTREILYRIPGDENYTKLASALDQMYEKIDEITAKVDQIINENKNAD